jgi:hypothetical protein
MYATWTIEHIIGDLGGEIAQPSNPYHNLSERGLHRCQVNTLKASFPAFQEKDDTFPQYSLDLGDGYAFLRAKEKYSCKLEDHAQAQVVSTYFLEREAECGNFPDDDSWDELRIARWACLHLPNGQTARSKWKEDKMTTPNWRQACCVKVRNVPFSFFT